MFEVCVMVEDKRLPKLMWALDGLVVGAPKVTPVRAAGARNGKVVSTQPMPGNSIPAQLSVIIRDRQLESMTKAELSALIKEVGGKASGLSYFAMQLRKHKVLGSFKSKDKVYPVLTPKE